MKRNIAWNETCALRVTYVRNLSFRRRSQNFSIGVLCTRYFITLFVTLFSTLSSAEKSWINVTVNARGSKCFQFIMSAKHSSTSIHLYSRPHTLDDMSINDFCNLTLNSFLSSTFPRPSKSRQGSIKNCRISLNLCNLWPYLSMSEQCRDWLSQLRIDCERCILPTFPIRELIYELLQMWIFLLSFALTCSRFHLPNQKILPSSSSLCGKLRWWMYSSELEIIITVQH